MIILLTIIISPLCIYFYKKNWLIGYCNSRPLIGLAIMVYLQVNALSEWIIGIYLHEFTNNEREISIPHKALPSTVSKISSSLSVNENR